MLHRSVRRDSGRLGHELLLGGLGVDGSLAERDHRSGMASSVGVYAIASVYVARHIDARFWSQGQCQLLRRVDLLEHSVELARVVHIRIEHARR